MENLIPAWLDRPSPDLATLRQHGIPYPATQLVGGVRLARDGRLLIPAWLDPPSIYHFVEDPALLGIIAFDPECPDRWELYPEDADVVMLGEVMLREAVWYSEPLPVFSTLLGWVRSGGAGVFPLDWPAFANEMLWSGVKPIAEDVAHGELIEHHRDTALNIGRPDILVRKVA